MEREKPLQPRERLGVVLQVSLLLIGFYLFISLSLLLISLLLLVELALCLILLRFGLAGYIATPMQRQLQMMLLFFAAFRAPHMVDYRIKLTRGEAPELFEMLDRLCRELKLALPNEVSIEMGVNAWVRLKGYRRGAGRTLLGIGFDLLAGMSREEAAGVLAHEMVHAKLVNRGLTIWMKKGLARMARLANAFSSLADAYREIAEKSMLCDFFLGFADWSARLGARLVATYSRQDEFDADRGASILRGAAPLSSALTKLEALAEKAGHLPWNERVAQLSLQEGFTSWLVKTLKDGSLVQHLKSEALDPYSTHPSHADRIAAIGGSGEILPDSGSAVYLLANPDAIAGKLVTEIQRVQAKEEHRDRKELDRWRRKVRRAGSLTRLQSFGVFLGLLGVVLWCIFSASPYVWATWLTSVAGVVLFFAFRYKDKIALPIPSFELFCDWNFNDNTGFEADQKRLRKELTAEIEAVPGKKEKLRFLIDCCNVALSNCEFSKALAVASLGEFKFPNSIPILLAKAVGQAAHGDASGAGQALQAVQNAVGIRTRSTIWGCAWGLFLLGDWLRSEAMLYALLQFEQENPTVWGMLSRVQANRGKSQIALASARRACSLAPENLSLIKEVLGLLLNAGQWQEAKGLLERFEVPSDPDFMLLRVRLHLISQEHDAAEAWAERFSCSSSKPDRHLFLARAFEHARLPQRAEALYRETLTKGHYPEACLALGRLAFSARNMWEARRHFAAALDLDQKLGTDAVGALALFGVILDGMVGLNEPIAGCKSWIASIASQYSIASLRNVSFMIFAPSKSEAQQYFQALVEALQPGKTMPTNAFSISEAPKEKQPLGVVRPGVQGVCS